MGAKLKVFLKKKIGPFTGMQWLVVAGIAGVALYIMRRRRMAEEDALAAEEDALLEEGPFTEDGGRAAASQFDSLPSSAPIFVTPDSAIPADTIIEEIVEESPEEEEEDDPAGIDVTLDAAPETILDRVRRRDRRGGRPRGADNRRKVKRDRPRRRPPVRHGASSGKSGGNASQSTEEKRKGTKPRKASKVPDKHKGGTGAGRGTKSRPPVVATYQGPKGKPASPQGKGGGFSGGGGKGGGGTGGGVKAPASAKKRGRVR